MQADVVVVGRGLIGVAATRHLVDQGVDVVAIGPAEPQDWASHPGVFASHYDTGRITRFTGPDPIWSELAARSIARYGQIEQRSGIVFHTDSGLVAASDGLDLWLESAGIHQVEHEVLDGDEIYDRFGIRYPDGTRVLLESSPAGHIDPRKLLLAQSRIARSDGATIVEREALTLSADRHSWRVDWSDGSVTAPSVLVTAGAFTNELLPEPLAFERYARTVLLAEMDPIDGLPALIWHRPEPEARVYWVPPVVYPDGRTRLKIGGGVPPDQLLEDGPALRQWFRSNGSDAEVDKLRETLLGLLPDVEVRSWDQHPCVTTSTVHGRPYIGSVAEGLHVAAGGNGSAAKSSDEIGRLAADIALGGAWRDKTLLESDFRPVLTTVDAPVRR